MSHIAFVHAHPDDEALLTSGSMRALVEAGHQVSVIMCTDGGAGLGAIPTSNDLAEVRREELKASLKSVGTHQAWFLPFGDSGLDGKATSETTTLVQASPAEIAREIATLVREHRIEHIVGYDQVGGYCHPDHVQVHRAVRAVADTLPELSVCEVTIARSRLRSAAGKLRVFSFLPAVRNVLQGFAADHDISFVVDVSPWQSFKRDSLKAHLSQTQGGRLPRSLDVLLKLSPERFDAWLGHEAYIHVQGDLATHPLVQLHTAQLKPRYDSHDFHST
jgi:LmbE family N-acetylglucosaminyl deacetylase